MKEQTPQDKYITVNGIKVHYWDEGSGDVPIILVHGINSNVTFWQENVFALAKTHRVIAVDLIGFGDTDKPQINYNVAMLAQFLYDFLQSLQLKRYYLVGHSLGSAVSLQFVILFPGLVGKLVLVSPVGLTHKLPWVLRLSALPFVDKLLLHINKKLIAKAVYLYVHNKSCVTEEFLQNNYRIAQLPGTQEVLVSLLRQNIDIHGIKKDVVKTLMTNLSKLTMPILVIWGKNDKLLSVENARAVLQLIPQAKLEIFDKCGHVPQLEHPEKFNQLVNDFL
jgi:4,5:9,10-diseco-3-hydroxy-5,9,17-trioxoandrosta-1(10),2-diene-4-oate hydrolase